MANTTASKKAKGSRLELYIAKRLRDVLGVDAKRMPLSGAISGFKSDIYTNLPVSIEAKNQEKVQLWEWWQQADSQAGLGKMPVLVISRNFNKEPLAVIKFEDLLTLFEWSLQAGWVSHIRKGRRTLG